MVKKLTIPKSRIGKREVGGQYYPQPPAATSSMGHSHALVAKELSIGKTAETIGLRNLLFKFWSICRLQSYCEALKKEKIPLLFFH